MAGLPPRETEGAMRERMLRDVALRAQRLDVDGIDTSVLEGGDGPSLVLLHGGIECGGVMWAPVVTGLAEHHRLVVADVPGLGESAPAARLDQGRFDAWFAELLRLTCPQPPAVVAHSLLGGLAARFAARQADLLGRLVVYAAPGIGPYHMPFRLRVVAGRFAVRPTAHNAERFDRYALFDLDATRRRDDEWFAAFAGYTLARAQISHVKATMRQLIKTGTKQVPDDELRSIGAPVDLLWGRHDRMVRTHLGVEAGARVGWPLHIIDRAAHAPHIEQPEAFVSTLLDTIHTSAIEGNT
jgi:pimeloyl-ACP methyl ester carboxylesterase